MKSVDISKPRLSVALVFALLAIVGLPVISACSGEADPSDPQGAYDIFRDALFDGDGEKAWQRVDDSTHQYFQQRYEALEEMDELIERFLPPTDHQIARSQSGAELVDEFDSGRDLFVRLLEPGEFPGDEAIRFGSEVREIQISEDGSAANVVTRGGQEFALILQDDDSWYVNLVDSGDFLDQSFQWLTDNEDALEQTVQDLIEDERRVREQIIADLMDLEEK